MSFRGPVDWRSVVAGNAASGAAPVRVLVGEAGIAIYRSGTGTGRVQVQLQVLVVG